MSGPGGRPRKYKTPEEFTASGPGGRPRKYKTPEEFTAKVDEYVEHCRENGEPVTWTGLALYMGFSSRSAIDEYKEYDGFLYSVKRAKSVIECAYEKRLAGNSPSGAIFALKNMGWSDKQERELTGKDGGPIQQEHTHELPPEAKEVLAELTGHNE